MKKIVFFLFALALVGLFSFYQFFQNEISASYHGETKQFIIKNGQSFPSINYQLHKQGFISSKRAFHYLAKYKKLMNKFKVGTYEVKSGMTLEQMMTMFTKGQSLLTKVTIPEGRNIYEVAKILESKNVVKASEFISLCKDITFAKSLRVNAPILEGYLFPETYYFSPGVSVKKVIQTMHEQFKSQIKNIDFTHSFLSKDEIITLASIVEKETGAKFERPTIAGVFINRLKKKMKLQSDPTTIYGMYERYNGNIRKKDLLTPSDYNTYTLPRLPVGPIAGPSLHAIKAVLNPEKHNFLYFVSKNDGTHVFTPTYKAHQKAVENFQLNRRNRKGKSWRQLKQK